MNKGKLFIAGPSKRRLEVRANIMAAREAGFDCFDWTSGAEWDEELTHERARRASMEDLYGVRDAKFFLWDFQGLPPSRGAMVEYFQATLNLQDWDAPRIAFLDPPEKIWTYCIHAVHWGAPVFTSLADALGHFEGVSDGR